MHSTRTSLKLTGDSPVCSFPGVEMLDASQVDDGVVELVLVGTSDSNSSLFSSRACTEDILEDSRLTMDEFNCVSKTEWGDQRSRLLH
jgi:hypothetical protein